MRAARRVALPGVTGLEVWDLVVGDTTLFAAAKRRAFPRLLAEAVRALRAGTARRACAESIGLDAIAFDQVLVGGGGWDSIPASRRIASFDTLPGGRFVGIAGGFSLLGGPGLVCDVGQSAIKLAWPGGRVLIERDLVKLPVRSRSDDPAHRRALVEYLGGALRRAPRFRRLVLALPAALRADGTPEGSSYPGMAGDDGLVEDALSYAGMTGTETLLVNDAELAALSARPRARGRALVLTVGFGVGAALLDATTSPG
ncbi:MAG: hypothetical protein ABI321_19055 [Polyangia bacterium]